MKTLQMKKKKKQTEMAIMSNDHYFYLLGNSTVRMF